MHRYARNDDARISQANYETARKKGDNPRVRRLPKRRRGIESCAIVIGARKTL